MTLSSTFKNFILGGGRSIRITIYLLGKIIRLILNTILPWFFKNQNSLATCNIPQPKTFNSFSEIDIRQTLGSLLWGNDFQSVYQNVKVFRDVYERHHYAALVKAFFPTKTSSMENINLNRTWEKSYFNQANINRPDKWNRFRHYDALFGDMMTSTQGIYKAKRVKHPDIIEKVKEQFKDMLEENRKEFMAKGRTKRNVDDISKCIVDALIEDDNLWYIDYPDLRKVEDDKQIRNQIGGVKYKNSTQTLSGESFDCYLEIPFAIFSILPKYYEQQIFNEEEDKIENQEMDAFVCVGATFNDSPEVYHPFDGEDMVKRDRWEMAKCHMAATDNNDFTLRVHLGQLHYASALFTTAISNVAKSDSNLKWLQTEFVDIMTPGLLQTNFLANMTLIDTKKPLVERFYYLRTLQSGEMLKKCNCSMDMLQFCPEELGRDAYISDAAKISNNLYEKYAIYIEYLFKKYQTQLQGKIRRIGEQIFRQVGAEGRYCNLSADIKSEDPRYLKKLLTNLAYLWCVHHGQTFSLISVTNSFYFYPSVMRKPLSALPTEPMTVQQKRQWLPLLGSMQDNTNLIKTVTYRTRERSILTNWNQIKMDIKIWNKVLAEHYGDEDHYIDNFVDHWDDCILKSQLLNSERTKKGLYYLHWLQISELPHALNI